MKEVNMNNSIKKHFVEKNYVVIRNALDLNLANISYNYLKMKAYQASYKKNHLEKLYDKEWDGNFIDRQAPKAFSIYGDPLMESILVSLKPLMEDVTQKQLFLNYAYTRLYVTNNDLKIHKDRESCEISTSICLGYDISNQKDNNYNWPFCLVDPITKAEVSVNLNPGDMLIYNGVKLEHYRNKFLGNNHAQLFLHYNDMNGNFRIQYDERSRLGIPKNVKTYDKIKLEYK
jgi:hypothetical protein